MNLLKKQLPLFFGMVAGILVLAEFYVPQHWLDVTREELLNWAQILASGAFVLGGLNLVQVNVPKIKRREEDWPYKVLLLVAAALTFLVGMPWHLLVDSPPGQVTVMTSPGHSGSAVMRGPAVVRVESERAGAMVQLDGGKAFPVSSEPSSPGWSEFQVKPGNHTVKVFMPDPVTGYAPLTQTFLVGGGQTAVAHARLPMRWGIDGRFRTWTFNYIFTPCNATMFSLLAFFIASAAFRAFRARNTEAALLLGAAIIVLLGRAPIGGLISERLPAITNWIIDIPNNAGRRAIMMGAALGGIVTGLRVILGLERSHLGSE